MWGSSTQNTAKLHHGVCDDSYLFPSGVKEFPVWTGPPFSSPHSITYPN